MSCDDTPTITAQDVPDASIQTILVGSKKRLSINVYQSNSDAALEECGGCLTRSAITIPPTITITSSSYAIYLKPDTTVVVASGTPSETDILDADSVLIGYRLSLMFDASTSPLNVVGVYMIVISYTLDDGSVSVVPVYAQVVAPDWLDNC